MKSISHILANNGYQSPTREQIAMAAFHLYVQNGSQHGHDLDDWLRAESLLKQKAKEVAKDQVSELKQKAAPDRLEIRPAGKRDDSLARDKRGTANRQEIRQQRTPHRPASRQPQWRTARSNSTA